MDEGDTGMVALRMNSGHGHEEAMAEAWREHEVETTQWMHAPLIPDSDDLAVRELMAPFKLPALCSSLHLWLKVKHDIAELLVDVVHNLAFGQGHKQVAAL